MSDPKKWRLWSVLKRRRITISELSEMCGYHRVSIQRVKAGKREASKGMRAAIALALQSNPDYLFEEVEEED